METRQREIFRDVSPDGYIEPETCKHEPMQLRYSRAIRLRRNDGSLEKVLGLHGVLPINKKGELDSNMLGKATALTKVVVYFGGVCTKRHVRKAAGAMGAPAHAQGESLYRFYFQTADINELLMEERIPPYLLQDWCLTVGFVA
jgi:hypothetical protein